ncbi:hypothetical protein KY290_001597 [Solanum tuberosum]|uniref:Uncharacterized protein n=1 Tax=Solanum tuberosum TaxID=4113 RepID=A0ABQ7WMT3_SOLTU|nr:hypothetical protein KY284_001633 [Solanum tuberosum]KAH0781999.1 hypothetical protein KY290_001597 [Solanum tuberosum]
MHPTEKSGGKSTRANCCIKKDGKDKEFEQYLHRSTKLKCKAHTLYQARHEPTPESTPAKKDCSARKRRLGDKIRERKTNLLEAASHNIQRKLVMKDVDYPKKKSQELSVEEHHREHLQVAVREKEMEKMEKSKELSELIRKPYCIGYCM